MNTKFARTRVLLPHTRFNCILKIININKERKKHVYRELLKLYCASLLNDFVNTTIH